MLGLPHGDVVGFKDATTESQLILMSASCQKPVSIAFEADQSFFQLYKTGVRAGQSFSKWYKIGVQQPVSIGIQAHQSFFPNCTRQVLLQLSAKRSFTTAFSPSVTAPNVVLTNGKFFQRGKGEWANVASCLVLQRILSCLGFYCLHLFFLPSTTCVASTHSFALLVL